MILIANFKARAGEGCLPRKVRSGHNKQKRCQSNRRFGSAQTGGVPHTQNRAASRASFNLIVNPGSGCQTEYSMPMSPPDVELSLIVGEPRPETIKDVISKMQAIDRLLPSEDGLKWFNWLYLLVTLQVDQRPPEGGWKSPDWLLRLDVIFAGLYFAAVEDYLNAKESPSSWRPLFEARYEPRIDRIQFALAGMNAHINHDLALALLATDQQMNVVPDPDGPEHTDYISVNNLLNSLMPTTLSMLATDALGLIAQDTGRIGQLLAFWNICEARNLAWDFADHLRVLPKLSRDVALDAQDQMTGALGRAILCTV